MRSSQVLFVFLALISQAIAETHTWYYKTSWVTANPDGAFERPVIGWNDTWPLPILRAKTGDRIQLYMINGFDDRNTSLHFHGLFQNGTSQMDGPEMVTQCPIPPGETMLYNFTVPNQVGTYWYHSHTSGQYGEGMRAAFIIEEPDNKYPFDFDEEVVLTLSEWYHKNSSELMEGFLSRFNPTGAEPIPDNLLFNDSHNTVWEVKPNTTYFVRIANVGRFVSQYLYMEDHEFEVVEIDGIYVTPNTTDLLYITVAQRYGVLIKTKNDTSKNYAFMTGFDDTMLDVIPKSLELNNTNVISYNSNNPSPDPYVIDEYDILDDFWLEPLEKIALYDEPDQTITVDVTMDNLGNGINYAFFNNITWTKPVTPALLSALGAGEEYAANDVIYGTNTNTFILNHGETIDIVLNNNDTGTHPFHLHGHVFQVVARGDARDDDEDPLPWSEGKEDAIIRDYPARRDTLYVRPQSYIVLRFKADNPGVWFFHCHIEWHLDQGLALQLIEAPQQLVSNSSQQMTEDHKANCEKLGIPATGNAAGNTQNFLDLTGENVQFKALPAGFTARGIVALVFSCVAGFLGLAAITWYGMQDISNIEERVAEDLGVSIDEDEDEEISHVIEESSSNGAQK